MFRTVPFPPLVVSALLALAAPALGQTTFPLKLNHSQSLVTEALRFEISADGSRVVYTTANTIFIPGGGTDVVVELYSVPAAGGASTKLNPSLNTGEDVQWFEISPDGSRVVYMADQDTPGVRELYSVPVAGGLAVKLNGPMTFGGNIALDSSFRDRSFAISPDGTRVVYRADEDTNNKEELYSVPIAGGAVTKLSGGQPGNVDRFQISPQSGRVVYTANHDASNKLEIFSVPITGGSPVKLNSAMAGEGVEPTDFYENFRISPNGSWVVYRADQDTPGQFELYSVPIAGGGVVGLLPFAAGVSSENPFRITSDSRLVVYQIDNGSLLYATEMRSPSSDQLTDSLAAVSVLGFDTTADSRAVVYHGDFDEDEKFELYSTYLLQPSGIFPIKLNTFLPSSGDVTEFAISPAGDRVIYTADRGNGEELYSVAVNGEFSTTLKGSSPGGDTVLQFKISPDGSRVVYLADHERPDEFELFSVPLAGGASVKLSGPLTPGGDVSLDFEIHPDQKRVLYLADQFVDQTTDLFVTKGQAFWEASSGNWFSSNNWRSRVVPNQTTEAVIEQSAVARIASNNNPAVVESLILGGGGGSSVVELDEDSALTVMEGVEMRPGAVWRGDGLFALGNEALTLPAGTEVQAAAGDQLAVESGLVSNAGRIEALGTAFESATLEIGGALTIEANSGVLAGHHSVFRLPGGVVNRGSILFGAGLNDVTGDILNESGGLVAVSGGATAVFWEDVTNNGAINVSASGGVAGIAVFFGALTGNGVSGAGQVFVEGDARPGFSPGTMAFGGDLSYGPAASLEIELGGSTPGREYDQVVVAGHLALGGELVVTLSEEYLPAAGTHFQIWDADSVSGEFSSVQLPVLPDGLFWHTAGLGTTGELRVGATPESYPAFSAHYDLSTPPNGDEDGDGISNLFEYLQGQHPGVADAHTRGPRIVSAEGGSRFVFAAAHPLGADLQLEIRTSTTLQDDGPGGWETVAARTPDGTWTGSVPLSITPGEDGFVTISLDQLALAPTEQRRFYRLRVTLAPAP